MKKIDIQELQQVLVSLSEEIREKPASPYFDGALMVLGRQLKFLHESLQQGEGVDMDKLKQEIKVVMGRMGDIPQRSREGFWPDKITEEAAILNAAVEEWRRMKGDPKDKPARVFDADEVNITLLAGVVTKLKRRGKIDHDIQVTKRGKTIWMVKA